MLSLLDDNREKTRKQAWFLSLAGFIPFGVISVMLFVVGQNHPLFDAVLDIFKVWSVIILSFLGGIRWGFAIANQPFDTTSLWLSVVGSILGWIALLLSDMYALLLLLLLFCAHGAWDSFFINAGNAPPWFGAIRIILTFLVATAHILVVVALAGGLGL